jgi:DNA adenine methylase
MRPGLLKYPGGKSYLADWIMSHFPCGWTTYVEPFVGGGAVLLSVDAKRQRVAGDLDAGLISLYREVQQLSPSFLEKVRSLKYCQDTFDEWRAAGGTMTQEDLAVKTLVTRRFSRGGSGTAFAWSARLRGGQPGDLNAWENFVARLPSISRQLRGVEFCCEDAVTLMSAYDLPETLFYLDPPYVHETRVSTQLYTYEMTLADHRRLVAAVATLRGACIISGYSHPLYDSLGWRRVTKDMPCHQSQSSEKPRREEVLWIKEATR